MPLVEFEPQDALGLRKRSVPSLPSSRNDPGGNVPPGADGPLLRLNEVSKSFGSKRVLDRVSLDLAAGEIVAFVGRSGCGKSTLLRILAGLEKPTSGQVWLRGQALTRLNPAARLMFQEATLLPWKSVRDNVRLAAPDRDRTQAERALAQVGLADRAGEWPAVLSGGQRQRVALARALASGAPLLLFDEPLGALDALTRLEMHGLMEEIWRQQHFTGVLVTHDVEEAVALADRVFVMDQGRFVREVAVDVPRPRLRSGPAFNQLRELILRQIFHAEG